MARQMSAGILAPLFGRARTSVLQSGKGRETIGLFVSMSCTQRALESRATIRLSGWLVGCLSVCLSGVRVAGKKKKHPRASDEAHAQATKLLVLLVR